MDPYLEDPSVWEEFHHVLVTESMYFLSERLPDRYVAKIQERVQLVSLADEAAERYVPDVAVARPAVAPSPVATTGRATTGAALLEPVTIPATDAIEVREGYVEIQRLPDYELVTRIEVLSPWNKFGEGVGEYRHKRRALVGRGVQVVEIDLLRRGTRTELARPRPPGDYCVFVFRGDRRPNVDVYAWGIRDALPSVRVPLKAPDPDVVLDLRAVVTSAYDRSRYHRKLRYDRPPSSPLAASDSPWAEELLTQARGR